MALRSLVLRNFRKYEQHAFAFHPQMNLIWGPNAQGKTTILEAIYLLTIGKSFRANHLKDLIRKGADSFSVQLTYEKNGVEQTLRYGYNGKETHVWHNQSLYRSPLPLLGILQGVVVTPDDASLVKDSPSVRRRFLDIQIAQVDPLYVHHLMRFSRAMKQRNALLKSQKSEGMEPWEREMAVSAQYLVNQRLKAVEDLNLKAQRIYEELTHESESFQIRYSSDPISLDEYLAKLVRNRSREMVLGFTLSGPHRHDLLLSIGGKEARTFASEGQQRSCVAALRLGEWQRLRSLAEEAPMLLYDDVGMSLDETRRANLFRHFLSLDQVFLTSTHEEPIGDFSCHRIRLS